MAHIHSETLDLCYNCLDLYVLTHYLVKINNILVYFCCLKKTKKTGHFVMNDVIFDFKIIAVLVSKQIWSVFFLNKKVGIYESICFLQTHLVIVCAF